MYISWAAYYEGRTDASYFNVLIPRFLEQILREEGIRPYDVGTLPSVQLGVTDRDLKKNAEEICARRKEFHVLFVHADTGGRGQEQGIANRREALIDIAVELCEFDGARVAHLSPRKELEAWAIADRNAVLEAFGLSGLPDGILPNTANEAEKHANPKSVLDEIGRIAGARLRDNHGILVRIAQEHNIPLLRALPSFRQFEVSLRNALQHVGCF